MATRVQTLSYSMPRGDSRSIPLAIPVGTYSAGASIFFALKVAIDDVLNDSSAFLLKKLTDADIVSNDGTNVNYLLQLEPADTNGLTTVPTTFFAEFEFVSADQNTVITYPDESVAILQWTITPDVNRRTSGSS